MQAADYLVDKRMLMKAATALADRLLPLSTACHQLAPDSSVRSRIPIPVVQACRCAHAMEYCRSAYLGVYCAHVVKMCELPGSFREFNVVQSRGVHVRAWVPARIKYLYMLFSQNPTALHGRAGDRCKLALAPWVAYNSRFCGPMMPAYFICRDAQLHLEC